MVFSILRILPVLAGIVFLAGCMSFDYVGQSFAPLNDSRAVNLIQGRDRIPADQFRIIGRGVLSGPGDTDIYDQNARLRQEARKHGADAVCIVSRTVKAAGLYPQSSGTFAPPLSASSNVDNLNSRGVAWETDSFGQTQTLKGEEEVRHIFETKVIFLKKIGDFNAEMSSRSSFL